MVLLSGSFKGPLEVHDGGFKVSPMSVGVFFSSCVQLHGLHRNRRAGFKQNGSFARQMQHRVAGKGLKCLQGRQCHGDHGIQVGKGMS